MARVKRVRIPVHLARPMIGHLASRRRLTLCGLPWGEGTDRIVHERTDAAEAIVRGRGAQYCRLCLARVVRPHERETWAVLDEQRAVAAARRQPKPAPAVELEPAPAVDAPAESALLPEASAILPEPAADPVPAPPRSVDDEFR